LAYAKERLSLAVHNLKEGSVRGGVDAVERTVGIAAIQLAVLGDGATLVAGRVRVIHIQSLFAIRVSAQDCPIVG
jgi:hypothetical protein